MKIRTQSTEYRTQKVEASSTSKIKGFRKFLIILLLVTCHLLLVTAVSAAKWGGVDESIVEKYAEDHGRPARDPLINTDQGDLLLFVFLLAGAGGGFAAGYYWRTLTENKGGNPVTPGRPQGKNRAKREEKTDGCL